MPHNPCLRIVRLQLAEQIQQGTLLGQGTGIGRPVFPVQPPFVAHPDAVLVPSGCMCTDLMQRPARMNHSVAGNVKVIADIGKSPFPMAVSKCFHRKIPVFTRRTAMDYDGIYFSEVLEVHG